MAKKKDNAPGKLREQAREQLAELGYEKLIEDFQLFDPFGDGSMDATADLVAMDGDEPVVLFAAADPGDAARPSIQDDAKFKAALDRSEISTVILCRKILKQTGTGIGNRFGNLPP